MWKSLIFVFGLVAAERVQTLALIKPDGVAKGIIGKIISAFEDANLRIDNLKLVHPNKVTLAQHYKEHVGRSYYPGLEAFMLEGPVIAIALSNQAGDETVITRVRQMIGQTDSSLALPGTLRASYGTDKQRNILHSSENRVAAEREIRIWFSDARLEFKDEL